MGVLGILSAGLSIMGAAAEYQAANDAADQQNQYYLDNAKAAQTAAANTYAFQQYRILQEKEAAEQDAFEIQVGGLKKRGTAYTSSGEAGISGLSVDALIGDLFAQEGRQQMSNATQYQMDRNKIVAEMEGTRAQAEARINSVRRANYPSAASYIIKGLSGATKAFGGGGGLQIQ
jgi:hypothetical protein